MQLRNINLSEQLCIMSKKIQTWPLLLIKIIRESLNIDVLYLPCMMSRFRDLTMRRVQAEI